MVNEKISWEAMFTLLTEYQKEYSHCNVSQKDAENNSLGLWVSNQRSMYKKGVLSSQKVDLLNSVGFDWDPSSSRWKEMFKFLEEYREKYGHSNVAINSLENKPLATWVRAQRVEYKKAKLPQNKIAHLNSLGFNWNVFDARWEAMFKSLCEYRKGHGNCNVPKKYSENQELGLWVMSQRSKSLSSERRARLDAIGFNWNPSKSR